MFTFFPQYFDELKKEVSSTIGSYHIIPADCKRLSSEIYRLTQKQISETTLKRVFGFAYSRYKPSLFTLDAMSVYCNYTGWSNFCEQQQYHLKTAHPKKLKWASIFESAEKISSNTLQILKNRSGIPYESTIVRNSLNEHLSMFLQTECSATIVAAPTGYGKSIALCHWIDQLLSGVIRKNKDILLLFNNTTIQGIPEGKGLNEWLLALIGIYNDDDLSGLASFEHKFTGKFYLIIDGLDDRHFKNNQFTRLFTQLIDIVSLYHHHKWFKVIVTLRSYTWINNRHAVSQNQHQWFTGFMIGTQRASNVPLFDINEFDQLSAKLHLPKSESLTFDLLNKLRYPLFFQIYFQIHHNQAHTAPADEMFIHELISSYMLHTTFKGIYSSEKILLLNGLIGEMSLENSVFKVSKLKTHHIIKEHQNAYQDLISIGVLRELNLSNDLKYNSFTEFADNHVLEYCIANLLLENNENIFDIALLNNINNTFPDGDHKLPVLKWCIYLTVTNAQPCPLDELPMIKLDLNERTDLFVFLGGLFKKQSDKNKKAGLSGPDWFEKSFDYFFGLEFLNDKYEQTLKTVLNLKLSIPQKIIVKTTLATIAILKMEHDQLEQYIAELKEFPDHYFYSLPINPLSCLESIYYCFNHNIIKKEALRSLTAFCFNPSGGFNAQFYSGTNDILYILGLRTLAICKNPKKSLRYIYAVDTFYKNKSEGFKFLWKIYEAAKYLSLANKPATIKLFNELQEELFINQGNFTPFMKVSFYALKARLIIFDDEQLATVNDVKYFIQICDDVGLKLLKVITLALLVAHFKAIKKEDESFNYFYFNYVKTVRSSGCRTETFLS